MKFKNINVCKHEVQKHGMKFKKCKHEVQKWIRVTQT